MSNKIEISTVQINEYILIWIYENMNECGPLSNVFQKVLFLSCGECLVLRQSLMVMGVPTCRSVVGVRSVPSKRARNDGRLIQTWGELWRRLGGPSGTRLVTRVAFGASPMQVYLQKQWVDSQFAHTI